jgi:hypothetical protein
MIYAVRLYLPGSAKNSPCDSTHGPMRGLSAKQKALGVKTGGLYLNEGIPLIDTTRKRGNALRACCLASEAFSFQSLEIGTEGVVSLFAFAHRLLGIEAPLLGLLGTLFG